LSLIQHQSFITTTTTILIQNLILINTHIGIKEYEDYSLLYTLVKILEFIKHISAFFRAKIFNLHKDLKLIISHVGKRYLLKYEDYILLYTLVKILEFTKHISAFFRAKIFNLYKDLKLIISHVGKRYSLIEKIIY
ncbi:Uncharacterized protein FWK35_00019243, partial [Aphis craccivora]